MGKTNDTLKAAKLLWQANQLLNSEQSEEMRLITNIIHELKTRIYAIGYDKERTENYE